MEAPATSCHGAPMIADVNNTAQKCTIVGVANAAISP